MSESDDKGLLLLGTELFKIAERYNLVLVGVSPILATYYHRDTANFTVEINLPAHIVHDLIEVMNAKK